MKGRAFSFRAAFLGGQHLVPSRLRPSFFDAVLGDPSLRLRRPGICVRMAVKIPNMQQPIQTNHDRIPKFYLYKMTVDNGGAPCVQDGGLTLAICKQTIRRVAPEGSVIIGFAGNDLRDEGYHDNSIVYAATVTRPLNPGEYCRKRMYAGRPDCVYKCTGKRFATKAKALFHSGVGYLEHDLGSPPDYDNAIVLLSDGLENFRYFGNRRSLQYKTKFHRLRKEIEGLTQGHRVNHDPELYAELLALKKLLWKLKSPIS